MPHFSEPSCYLGVYHNMVGSTIHTSPEIQAVDPVFLDNSNLPQLTYCLEKSK